MKKILPVSFYLIFFTCYFSYAQKPAIVWQKCYGSFNGDYTQTIRPTSDGGYIVAGYTESNGGDVVGYHGNLYINDIWILKLKADGSIEWQKCLGGDYMETGADIRQTPDGGYIVAGTGSSKNCSITGNHGGLDYWVVKLDSKGDIKWQKMLGGSANEYAYSIDITNDGGYVVTGETESNDGDVKGNHGLRDYWVVKLDGNGILQWQKCLGGSKDEESYSIRATNDGGCIVAGYTESSDGDVTTNYGKRDYWVAKLNNTGNLQWQKSLGGSEFDGAWSVQLTPDGGYIVAGYSSSNDGNVSGNHNGLGPGDQDFWVVKLGSDGTLQWQKCYGGDKNEIAYYIQTTSDGGYLVAGSSESSNGDLSCNAGITDMWVIKINSTGILEWQKSMGGSYYDQAMCVQPLSDGSYIVAGNTCSNNVSGWHTHNTYEGTCDDYWIVKLSAPSSSTPQPTVTISPASGKVCSGRPATLTANALYAGTNPTYQWTRNGAVVGTNSAYYTASDFANNDIITCTVTAGGACETSTLQGSAKLVLSLNSPINPSVTITTNNNFICDCSPGNFSATVTNGGSSPFYQWQLNDVNTGSNSPVYVNSGLKPGDVVKCIYSDQSGCIPGGSVTSNTIQMQSGTIQNPSIQISSSEDTICSGTTVTFSATATNAGTSPSYQWKINGTNAGTNSDQFTSSSLLDGDVVNCTITTDPSFTCTTSNSQVSNSIKIVVTGQVDPSVTIAASNNPVCAGSTISFTAIVLHAGSNPSYQWLINGVSVATTQNYTGSSFTDKDQVNCIITVDPLYTCTTKSSVSSNTIILTVKNQLNPTLSISVDKNDVCEGTTMTFTALALNAGTTPQYQWMVNNAPVTNNQSSVYSTSSLSSGDQLYCKLLPDAAACSVSPVLSDTIIAIVNSLPIIVISPVDTIINSGAQVHFRVTISGSVQSYQWSPVDKLSDASLSNALTARLDDNVAYTLTVENDKGCKATASALIRVDRELYMPTAFTPNGDGLNDLFRIPPGVDIKLKEFSVFDRWGNKVFTTLTVSKGWDGTLKGKKLDTGVYIYVISGKTEKGDVNLKGNVLLIR
jgi:gliding motility-associated-like protein